MPTNRACASKKIQWLHMVASQTLTGYGIHAKRGMEANVELQLDRCCWFSQNLVDLPAHDIAFLTDWHRPQGSWQYQRC